MIAVHCRFCKHLFAADDGTRSANCPACGGLNNVAAAAPPLVLFYHPALDTLASTLFVVKWGVVIVAVSAIAIFLSGLPLRLILH